jgi:hypothetical protein
MAYAPDCVLQYTVYANDHAWVQYQFYYIGVADGTHGQIKSTDGRPADILQISFYSFATLKVLPVSAHVIVVN